MMLNTEITNVSIESMKNQNGNALLKAWYSPFSFYIMGTYVDNPKNNESWIRNNYRFDCAIINLDDQNAKATFIGVSRFRRGRRFISPGQSDNRVVFNACVKTPGRYVAAVYCNNDLSTARTVEFEVIK